MLNALPSLWAPCLLLHCAHRIFSSRLYVMVFTATSFAMRTVASRTEEYARCAVDAQLTRLESPSHVARREGRLAEQDERATPREHAARRVAD